jgi:tetratricopeptide (TPR) repeat protein
MAMGLLTAALIVRDEAAFIEGCLASLVDRVDEIVLVDTGSHDDTIAKALRFPIKLHHFAWCDDFSAARNFALERASGEWILYIDADERFEVPPTQTLAAVLADERAVAFNLRFHPRVDWTPYAELRLFRNDPRIRFRGAIHERIHESVEAVARADGKTIADCDLTLRHLGYEDDQSHKNPRNIPLLRARLARDPSHLFSWWHLGQCLCLAGDEDGAIEAWSNGTAVARALPKDARQLSDALSEASLIRLKVKRGEDVAAQLREALALYPGHLSLQWIDATLALERGNEGHARPVLEALAAIDADGFHDRFVSYDKALFRHLAKEALALCHFRAGRFADAARLYRSAAIHAPNREECEIKARLSELRADATTADHPGR